MAVATSCQLWQKKKHAYPPIHLSIFIVTKTNEQYGDAHGLAVCGIAYSRACHSLVTLEVLWPFHDITELRAQQKHRAPRERCCLLHNMMMWGESLLDCRSLWRVLMWDQFMQFTDKVISYALCHAPKISSLDDSLKAMKMYCVYYTRFKLLQRLSVEY